MTKVTLDNKEYDRKDLTDEQNGIVDLLNTGTSTLSLLEHMKQCVSAIQKVKSSELKQLLEGNGDNK
tara:strand:+ start:214 stop:414 length:201 start_codon:yes stop_codon:yes gene_type:complete